MMEGHSNDLKYGWRSFTPKWIQVLNNSKCFLFCIVMYSALQGLTVNGITNMNLPAIEKRFQLNSKDLGLIAASNDISAILIVSFVSFYGGFGNKIKWLGYGSLITGLGCLLFALPQLLIGPYQPRLDVGTVNTRKVDACAINNGSSSTDACFSGYESNQFYLFIFCLAQMLMGAGTSPLFSLAPAYIDENVHPKASPVYLAVFFAGTLVGPGLGFMLGGTILSGIYVDVDMPEGSNLTPRDPRWIGAWWLGYIVGGVIMLLSAVFILGFPRELPGSKEMREKAIKEGVLPKKDTKLQGKIKEIIPATMSLIRNPTYIFNTLALTASSLFGGGIGTFIPKFAQLNYGVNPAIAGLTLGIVFILGATSGVVLGGVAVRRFKLKKSCKLSAKYCLIFQIICVWTALAFLIRGCDDVPLAGVLKPYSDSALNEPNLLAPCNMNCSCSVANINPVCGEDQSVYFSPCHAGCSSVTGPKASNCSCIQPEMNRTAGWATKGYCDRGPGCKNYYFFLAMAIVLLLVVFLTAIPNKTVVLRSVPDNQRSYALGFQFIFQRSLGFLPGPVLFGWMFDSRCLLWGESCGRRGRCQIYDVWRLSVEITIFGSIVKGLSILLYFASYWFCKPSYDEEREDGLHSDELEKLKEEEVCKETVI